MPKLVLNCIRIYIRIDLISNYTNINIFLSDDLFSSIFLIKKIRYLTLKKKNMICIRNFTLNNYSNWLNYDRGKKEENQTRNFLLFSAYIYCKI